VVFHLAGAQPPFQSLGSNSLVYGITTLLQKKIRQVYPVWCSRLHDHTLFIKKLCKKLGDLSILWGGPDPAVVAPMPPWCSCLLNLLHPQLSSIHSCNITNRSQYPRPRTSCHKSQKQLEALNTNFLISSSYIAEDVAFAMMHSTNSHCH